jgi:hypothetical protein
MLSNEGDLLHVFDASSGLLVVGDACKLLGDSTHGTAMLAVAAYLRMMRFE